MQVISMSARNEPTPLVEEIFNSKYALLQILSQDMQVTPGVKRQNFPILGQPGIIES
jgi:hypothetical protein